MNIDGRAFGLIAFNAVEISLLAMLMLAVQPSPPWIMALIGLLSALHGVVVAWAGLYVFRQRHAGRPSM